MPGPDDIPTGGLIPELAALLALWRRRYRPGDMPAQSRFQPSDLERWSRHIVWIEAEDDGFRLRNFGMDLIRRFGRYAGDHAIDELATDVAAGLREVLWRTMANAAPVPAAASVSLGRRSAVFAELALPLAGSGGRITLLLLASYEIGGP
ncbi:MAG TPA: hypothetical protein VG889_02730 [Rhizomicrobium sp.]|nr:hypothetical protein [Rhizomicrobium sp.]